MEFQKFLEEQKRMCNSFTKCSECLMRCSVSLVSTEFRQKNDAGLSLRTLCDLFIVNNPKTAEKIVEKWAKENPVMTNGQKFCEVFGLNLLAVPVYSKNDPRIHIKGVPFEEWLKAEYRPPQEV
jgi:hypothetical protein